MNEKIDTFQIDLESNIFKFEISREDYTLEELTQLVEKGFRVKLTPKGAQVHIANLHKGEEHEVLARLLYEELEVRYPECFEYFSELEYKMPSNEEEVALYIQDFIRDEQETEKTFGALLEYLRGFFNMEYYHESLRDQQADLQFERYRDDQIMNEINNSDLNLST